MQGSTWHETTVSIGVAFLFFFYVSPLNVTSFLHFTAGKVLLVLAVAACFYLGQVIATPACDSGDAGALVEKCRTDLLQVAGHNFTEDCENGVVKDFMRCVDAVQGCTNLSVFAENTIFDHYGCMDTDIIVHKREGICGFHCRVSCLWGKRNIYTCTHGVLKSAIGSFLVDADIACHYNLDNDMHVTPPHLNFVYALLITAFSGPNLQKETIRKYE